MKKYYLACLIINLVITYSMMYIYRYLARVVCLSFRPDELGTLYFISDFVYIELFFLFFAVSAPLAILCLKSYKYHWLLFLVIMLLFIAIYIVYYKNMTLERLMFETFSFAFMGMLISILVYISTIIIFSNMISEFLYKSKIIVESY